MGYCEYEKCYIVKMPSEHNQLAEALGTTCEAFVACDDIVGERERLTKKGEGRTQIAKCNARRAKGEGCGLGVLVWIE